ncbi:MAG: DUF3592 domain-containing protein [Chloroflexota bacterium]
MDAFEFFFIRFFIRLLLIYPLYKFVQMGAWWFQLRSFKTTAGIVVSDGIKKFHYYHKGWKHFLYREQLEYQYFVDEKKYLAHSISKVDDHFLRWNRSGRGKRNAEYWNNLYPKGKTVKVYYDPKNPERAYLFKTIFDKNTAVMFAIWLAFELFLRLAILFNS